MSDDRIVYISTDQMDAVLDDLMVLRPPVDRVRLTEEFTTCDVVLIYDRPESNPCQVLTNPAYLQQTRDDGRGDVNPVLAGWLVVAKGQIDVLDQAQRSRESGQPVNLALLASLLDDAGRGAPAIVPPTPAQLARPRWR